MEERQGLNYRCPYAETKEQLGGILVLEAGPFEIRPAEDLTE
jgi:hypothetical protein